MLPQNAQTIVIARGIVLEVHNLHITYMTDFNHAEHVLGNNAVRLWAATM